MTNEQQPNQSINQYAKCIFESAMLSELCVTDINPDFNPEQEEFNTK